MGVKTEQLITKDLKICENCEWCHYHGEHDVLARCMLDNTEKGLVETCSKFKKSTGNHFTIYY